jgi:glutathione synthase/RimK-type ligase-like ATP-grasp enzyme
VRIAVMTDHGSGEGSSSVLAAAVECLTGTVPTTIDARPFLVGGAGRAIMEGGRLTLTVPAVGAVAQVVEAPEVVVVYEIPPVERARFAGFQRVLRASGVACLGGGDARAWHAATDKGAMVARFRRAGVAHMETLTLHTPDAATALAAFTRLGGDVWARPVIGAGGADVFHVCTPGRLEDVRLHYAATGQGWLLSRDAGNVDREGRRHQLRVVVLGEEVLRVCEHVQHDPDQPCNESLGAVSSVLRPARLPRHLARLAVDATRALGLPFGGVDLVAEHGGVVFEVNVHPVLDVPGGLPGVAVPFVKAHY